MKISLLILVSLVVTALLGRRSAALRHWVLAVTIAAAAVTPLLELVVPAWHLPVGGSTAIRRIGHTTAPAAVAAVAPSRTSQPIAGAQTDPVRDEASGPFRRAIGSAGLEVIWIAGAAISLLVLLAGLARLAWLASHAERLTHGAWPELADRVSRDYGLRRPVVLLQSDHPSLLLTWGLARPRILLPAAAAGWPDDLVRVVLSHELAHIRRGDWIVQMAASLLRAAYWFNPIVWIACRRLRLESEHACDDTVMNRGVTAPDYAERLLDLARTLNHPRTWLPAPAMARPSSLERRIRAMLNDRLNRSPVSKSARVATVLALLTIAVALAAAQTSASLSGTVVDPQGAVVPGVRLTLSNAERASKYEVQTTSTGQFEFVGLPAGDYSLESQLPGFATSRQTITVNAPRVELRLALHVGSLQETVTIVDSDGDVSNAAVQLATPRANPPCSAAPGGGTRIGGNIRPPRRVRDAKPQFPPHLRGTGTEGVVVIEGRIGLDGFLKDLTVRNPVHPDLAQAALSAVSQWQWDSTLLNCEPVEVAVTITARFLHQP